MGKRGRILIRPSFLLGDDDGFYFFFGEADVDLVAIADAGGAEHDGSALIHSPEVGGHHLAVLEFGRADDFHVLEGFAVDGAYEFDEFGPAGFEDCVVFGGFFAFCL